MKGKSLTIENAKIIFRNFAGEPTKFNPAGSRNFCVVLSHEDGTRLAEDGWNIRWLDPREPGDQPTPYLQVKVSFENVPPKVCLITSTSKKFLDEGSIAAVDYAEISNADIIINPYNWEVQGKTGLKAYLKSAYITIVEDEFEAKYRDIPENRG